MRYSTPQQRIEQNEQKGCKAKNCNRHRKTYSGYCSIHNQRKVSYGDPEGRRIYPKDFERETLKVKLLMQANSQHEGMKQGVSFFSQWIQQACTVGHVLGQKHILRLQDEAITGEELLMEVAALYLYCWTYPWALQEGLPLDYATGIAILTKSHMYKRGCISCRGVRMTLRRQVGQYARERIGPLLLNIVRTIQKQEKEEAEQRKVQSLPLYLYQREGGDSNSEAL